MCGVPAAPTTVLPDLDPVRRIPPGLVRLIVAALALLTGERYADSNVRGHVSSTYFGAEYAAGQKKTPGPRPEVRPKE
jgi:hypothetical protein